MSLQYKKPCVSFYLDESHEFVKAMAGQPFLFNHLLTLSFGNNLPEDPEEREALLIKRIVKAMQMIRTEEYEKENNIIRPWEED